ncbi:PREDICTED: phosphatidylinositol 4-phosphate 3-kinase C2 domain-containing subunit gamma [Propithecus coquereli]|uniref:phosphatidylinositol 4-phosphate 3-kinase C2 domain-containing subunit gamma n=1 Tax=Propithecus coquereli TaxID=379532 RepID=UPI00063F27F3|nr:PREDICTED: phosphatidylinositol 4-phosphate 3-kinase C2 domain-containing subunit gamma [Propithecus coquereli]
MAYCWQIDPNPDESHEKQYEHQEFHSINQFLSSSQVSLGFDQLVVEISNKTPLSESAIEENTFFGPTAPNLNPRSHSLDETHQISLNKFTSKNPELSWHQVRKTPVIGFSPSVLPKPQDLNRECSWGNPMGHYHGTDDSGFSNLAPSPTSLDKINPQRELENDNYNYHIGFESSILSTHSSSSTDFMPEEHKWSGHVSIGEPSLMLSKGSFLPRMWESTWPKNIEAACLLPGICKKLPQSGVNDSSNCLVKDLIAEILHFCTNDQLFPKDHILSICGSEEFLQNDHCLGSHKMFQKDKSVIQLHLQKNREALGKLSRKSWRRRMRTATHERITFPQEQHHESVEKQRGTSSVGKKKKRFLFYLSRQCLLTLIKKYDFHLKCLLKTQENANNIIEEVKRICSVLGCVETKQITDAANELSLILQRKAEHTESMLFLFSYKAFSFSCSLSYAGKKLCQVRNYKEISDERFPQLAKAIDEQDDICELFEEYAAIIDLLIGEYNERFTDFENHDITLKLAFQSHLVDTIKAPKELQMEFIELPVDDILKSLFDAKKDPIEIWKNAVENPHLRINFPLEIKSLPRESMLIIKLYGIVFATNNANLLAWTCLPLFPKEKSILGSMLFSVTLQSEPPLEMIAPGVWDVSQPSPVTLQVSAGYEIEVHMASGSSFLNKLIESWGPTLGPGAPYGLSEEKRRYLWFYRSCCNSENCSLPLVLGSAPGWDERTVSEMHMILRKWTFSDPLEALGLLTSSLLNPSIFCYNFHTENKKVICLLLQAVKFEWNLESPLVQLLLHRSLQSIQVAHRLYWLLTDAQNEAYFKSWYQKLLAALQFCVGKALRDEFSKERKLIKILGDIGEKVKSASDHQRQEVLKKEIGRLEEFFQDGNICRLPLNPALCIKGIDRDACSYFTSNALPLKIPFINANPMGKNISIIFKAGDDLRQDMLVLQIIQVMDNIWLQEGLDMQMIIYRCLSTGKDQGLVQMVPDAVTLAKIHRHSGLIGPLKENTIKKWFSKHNHLKADYEKALRNFFYSCAGWCVVTFILGVCDRHNDNIMLTKSGHMFHIDFGKFLGHAQTFGGIKRDRAPFIFTSEMEYFITEGGKNPQHFQDFVELCCRAYNIVRKHSRLLLNLLEMMLYAGLPELSGIQDLKYVYNNLRPQDTDLEATSHFTKKIKESLECFPVKLNNLIHTLAQMSATSPAKSTSQIFPQESCLLRTTRSIQRATILGFSKKPSNLYLIQVTHSDNETSLTEKSFDQFSKLHSQLQKQFPSLALPEFPHWWHLPFTNSDHKRFRDLNHYMEQLLNGSYEVANQDIVLAFSITEATSKLTHWNSIVLSGEKFSDKKPQVQLVISYEDVKLTILVKHMKNIHLPDGSAPSAHVEFYLLPYPSEVRRRKTKSVPKCTDPTYNEIVVYDEVTELQGHVLMLIVKSKTVFVGAINIQLCSVPLNEEKWYPLGNSII